MARLDKVTKTKDVDRKILSLVKHGMNARQMAERLGVSRDKVINVLKKNGYRWKGTPYEGRWIKGGGAEVD